MKNSGDYWSDYWSKDGSEGEVFVTKGGSRPDYIASYWGETFQALPNGTRVIDIASGAGSIFEGLDEVQRQSLSLYATDLSLAALEILKKRIPETTVCVCSSLELPFASRNFNLVVSQFGLEYAGIEAFREAARLVVPGGRFVTLCHYKGGYIDQRNAAFLSGAKVALESKYIETAIALTKAMFSGSKTRVRKYEPPFITAQIVLAKSFQNYPDGIHRHLYFGYRKLYMNMQNHLESDVIGWLYAMKKDIKKNIYKVSEIRKVSLDDKNVDQIASILSSEGLKNIRAQPLMIPGSEQIVAWSVSADKTA